MDAWMGCRLGYPRVYRYMYVCVCEILSDEGYEGDEVDGSDESGESDEAEESDESELRGRLNDGPRQLVKTGLRKSPGHSKQA